MSARAGQKAFQHEGGTAASIHCTEGCPRPRSPARQGDRVRACRRRRAHAAAFAATGIDGRYRCAPLPSGRVMTGIMTANIVAVVAVFDEHVIIAVISAERRNRQARLAHERLERTADRARSSLCPTHRGHHEATQEQGDDRVSQRLKNFDISGAPSPRSTARGRNEQDLQENDQTAVLASGFPQITHSKIAARSDTGHAVPDTSRRRRVRDSHDANQRTNNAKALTILGNLAVGWTYSERTAD